MKKILILIAAFCALFMVATRAEAVTVGGLTIVQDAKSVCMVTNHYMGVPQIPVQKDGKTYYGCCQGCVGKIQNDPAARQSADPVTGSLVDKADAVIAKDDAGRVYYFESEETYRMFLEIRGSGNQ